MNEPPGMRFLVRLAVTAAALWVAVELVPGVSYVGHWAGLFAVALVFGAVNAVVRPILVFLTCPLIVLTFGLFIFILNAVMLVLTGALANLLGIGFHVADFFAALLAALVVSVVSAVLNLVVGEHRRT